MSDLYKKLLRKEAKLVMQIEIHTVNREMAAAKEAKAYKNLITNRRLRMKDQSKGIA